MASRTSNSIKNSSVALIMYFINLILQFYSRKIFLEYLGTEILGLNTTATNLLQFLNLAELGIGSAVAFNLYKPIAEGDNSKISEIISFQGHLYKRIALGIVVASIMLMFFFPLIFKKIELPLWYAYASFIVLLFSSLLSYFVNYKQVVLTASQQDYKITYSYKSVMALKVIAQIIAISYFCNGYIWWLVLEAIFAVIASIFLHIVTIKSFPYIVKTYPFNDVKHKYKHIESKIKQVFFHKISGFALTQASPLILYGFTTLTVVTFYQNYMLIYMGIVSLMAAVFNGITASIGNVFVEHPERLFIVFKELFSIRFYISAIVCFGFYLFVPQFIEFWIGAEYILPSTTLILLTILLFITLTRQTVENYLFSLGLFQDIWAPVVEMILNIGFSIWFGYYYGLNGIICGMLISLIAIVLIWKPYFLFTYGLKLRVRYYWSMYIKHTICLVSAVLISEICWETILRNIENDIYINLISMFIIFGFILLTSLIFTGCEIISFIQRIRCLIHKNG